MSIISSIFTNPPENNTNKNPLILGLWSSHRMDHYTMHIGQFWNSFFCSKQLYCSFFSPAAPRAFQNWVYCIDGPAGGPGGQDECADGTGVCLFVTKSGDSKRGSVSPQYAQLLLYAITLRSYTCTDAGLFVLLRATEVL